MADVDVTLGLNANQLHSELSDAKSKLSGFAGNLKALGAGFLGGFGVAQIRQAVTAALSYGSTIQDLSERFGVSAESLQKFGNVAEKNGGSLEGVAKAFQFLEKNREKALADPKGGVAKHFEGLGVSISDLESKGAEDIMLRIGESSLNAADGVAVLGKGFFGIRTTLAQIADFGFDKTPIVSNADIARVDQFDDALTTVHQTIKALAVTIIGELIPAVGRAQGFFAKPFEAITRLGDNTPQGAAATDQGDIDVAAITKRHREEAAGKSLPDELAPAAIIDPEAGKKKKRRFDEADTEADYSKEDKKDEKERIKESDSYEKKNLDDYYKDQKENARDQKREVKADQRARKVDQQFANNPAGLSLHDYATQGSGEGGAKARQAEQEEALARNLQLSGNKKLAEEHQNKAEKLKKELGLPSKEDQKDQITKGLNDAKVLQNIEKNTANAGANK